MGKPPSIASIVRNAATSEGAFVDTVLEVLRTEETPRIIEIFGRLNVPKIFPEQVEQPAFDEMPIEVSDFELEATLADGFNTYNDRHMRKMKWHTAHPENAGAIAVVGIFSVTATIEGIRVRRVLMLLQDQEIFTAQEWGLARELLNRTYRDYRELCKLMINRWLPTVMETCDREEIRANIETLPALIRARTERFHRLKNDVENRRLQIAVKPDGYPAVRPPRYFGGDLLDVGAWRIYTAEINGLIDSLDQVIEA